MKLLLVLDDPRRAQSFVDYLADIGLKCELTLDDDNNVSIWLVNESRYQQAQQEVKRFIAEPLHPRYQDASWRQGDTHVHFAEDSRQPGWLSDVLSRTGPVNMLVLLACVAIYGLSWLGLPMFGLLAFPSSWESLLGSEFWRAFTPALLHFSLMHLVFNLFWWWYLGGMVERRLGHGKLLVLLLVAAVLPNLMQFWASGPRFGGLSGVVYALLAYVWLSGRLNPARGIGLPDGMAVFMVVWLVLGFAGVLGPVANLAHLGGGLIGLLQAWFDRGRRTR
ncbi:rhomboid family intramembrane serine protease GlpG [Oceanisphaera psychrotolerans]|uniref:Rhomboid family intramembrane serine protease GlpG n=1 Tax=Oceanisphaera psychrotolerans TaxID=1414654 RepID=A0A1J4QFQ1_9GAMM|nr:rhomboid family intramembrane serine protease GlpG [Oceanisphaera psychrotolerans]OIN09559.1 rhomboid family intramembrane serine protease GlpG [Oceanisphaera psychrotolerans]